MRVDGNTLLMSEDAIDVDFQTSVERIETLENELKNLIKATDFNVQPDQVMKTMRSQLDLARAALAQKESEMRLMESLDQTRKNILDQELGELTKQYANLQGQFEATLQQLTLERSKHASETESLVNQVRQLETKIKDLTGIINDDSETQALKNQLMNSQDDNLILQAQILKFEDESKAKQKAIEWLETTISEKSAELDRLMERGVQKEKALESEIASLREHVNTLVYQLTEKESQIKRDLTSTSETVLAFERERATQSSKIQSLTKTIDEQNRKISELNSKLQEKAAYAKKLQQECESARNQAESARIESEKWEFKFDTIEKQSRATIERLENDLFINQLELEKSQKEHKAATFELRESHEAQKTLEHLLLKKESDFKETIQRQEAELHMLKVANSRLESELQNQTKQRAELESVTLSQSSQIAAKNDQIAALEIRLAQLNTENGTLKQEVSATVNNNNRKSQLAQWELNLRKYASKLAQDKKELYRFLEELRAELTMIQKISPLRDILTATEAEISRLQVVLAKTSYLSPHRNQLDDSLGQLLEQRDLVRSLTERSQSRVLHQSENLARLTTDLALNSVPPPPPHPEES